jgi:hypothetical protein
VPALKLVAVLFGLLKLALARVALVAPDEHEDVGIRAGPTLVASVYVHLMSEIVKASKEKGKREYSMCVVRWW